MMHVIIFYRAIIEAWVVIAKNSTPVIGVQTMIPIQVELLLVLLAR